MKLLKQVISNNVKAIGVLHFWLIYSLPSDISWALKEMKFPIPSKPLNEVIEAISNSS